MNGACLTTTIALLGDTNSGKSTLAKRWSSISNFERLYRGFVDSLDENDQLPLSVGSGTTSGAVSRTNTGVSFSPPSAKGDGGGQTLSKTQAQIMRQESLRYACSEAGIILHNINPGQPKSKGAEYFSMDVVVEGCPEAAAHRVFLLDTPGDVCMSSIPNGLIEKQSMKGGVQAAVIMCIPPKDPSFEIPPRQSPQPWNTTSDVPFSSTGPLSSSNIVPAPSSPTHPRRRTSIVSVLDIGETPFSSHNHQQHFSTTPEGPTVKTLNETPRTATSSFQEFKTAHTLLSTPHNVLTPANGNSSSRPHRFISPSSKRTMGHRRNSDASFPSGSSSQQSIQCSGRSGGMSPPFSPPSPVISSGSPGHSSQGSRPIGATARRGSFVSIATSNNAGAEEMDKETDQQIDISQMPEYLRNLAAKLEMCERNKTPVLLFHVGVPGEQEGFKIISDQKRRQSSVDYRRGNDDVTKILNITKAAFGQLVKRYTSTIFRCLVLMDGDDQHYDEVGFLATTKALADVVQHSHDFRQYQTTRIEYEQRRKKEQEEAELRKCHPKKLEDAVPVALEYEVITEMDDVETVLKAAHGSTDQKVYKLDVRICGAAESGKTALLSALVDNFSRVHYDPTEGPEVASCLLKLNKYDPIGKALREPNPSVPRIGVGPSSPIKKVPPIAFHPRRFSSPQQSTTPEGAMSNSFSVTTWGIQSPTTIIDNTSNAQAAKNIVDDDEFESRMSRWNRQMNPENRLKTSIKETKDVTISSTTTTMKGASIVHGNSLVDSDLKLDRQNFERLQNVNASTRTLLEAEALDQRMATASSRSKIDKLSRQRQNTDSPPRYKPPRILSQLREARQGNKLHGDNDDVLADALVTLQKDGEGMPSLRAALRASSTTTVSLAPSFSTDDPSSPQSKRSPIFEGTFLDTLNNQSSSSVSIQQQKSGRGRSVSGMFGASGTYRHSLVRSDDKTQALSDMKTVTATTFQRMREAAGLTAVDDYATRTRRKQTGADDLHKGPCFAGVEGLTRKRAAELYAADHSTGNVARRNNLLHLTFHDGPHTREQLHSISHNPSMGSGFSGRRPTQGPSQNNSRARRKLSVIVSDPLDLDTTITSLSQSATLHSPLSTPPLSVALSKNGSSAQWSKPQQQHRLPATVAPQKEWQIRILVVDGSKHNGLEEAALALEGESKAAPHTLVIMTKFGEEGGGGSGAQILPKLTPGGTARRRRSSFVLDPSLTGGGGVGVAGGLEKTQSIAGSDFSEAFGERAAEAPTRRPTIQQYPGSLTDQPDDDDDYDPEPNSPPLSTTGAPRRRPSWARANNASITTNGSFAFTPPDSSLQRVGKYQQGVTMSEFEEFAGKLGAYSAVADARQDQWVIISRFLTAVLVDEERVRKNVPAHSLFSPPPTRHKMALPESILEGTVIESDKVYGVDAQEDLLHIESDQRHKKREVEIREALCAAQDQNSTISQSGSTVARGLTSTLTRLRRNSSFGGGSDLASRRSSSQTQDGVEAPSPTNITRQEDRELRSRLRNPRLQAALSAANRAEAAGRPIPMEEAGLQSLFNEFDVNHNGLIDETELARLLFRFSASKLFDPVEIVKRMLDSCGLSRTLNGATLQQVIRNVQNAVDGFERDIVAESTAARIANNSSVTPSAILSPIRDGGGNDVGVDLDSVVSPEEELVGSVIGIKALAAIKLNKTTSTTSSTILDAHNSTGAASNNATTSTSTNIHKVGKNHNNTLLKLSFDQFALAMAFLARL